MKKNIAVILAGGSGLRLGRKLAKQFIKFAGKTIIEHTLDVFESSKYIDDIIIVVNKDYITDLELLISQSNYTKLSKILPGGNQRSDSSLAAINAFKDSDCADNINLIFHDAVRPFVTDSIIHDVVIALEEVKAVGVAIDSTDTLVHLDCESRVVGFPDRVNLKKCQTPQAFNFRTIEHAYHLALKDKNFKATDDCGVVKKYLPEENILITKGSEYNIKITYELDLLMAEHIYQLTH